MTYDYTVYILLVYDFIVEFIGYACLCIIVVLRFFRTLPKIRNKDGITTTSESFLCYAGVVPGKRTQ